VLHFIVGPTGVGVLNSLNGGDLWRVTLHGGEGARRESPPQGHPDASSE
jgi:hypothetical protein